MINIYHYKVTTIIIEKNKCVRCAVCDYSGDMIQDWIESQLLMKFDSQNLLF